MGAFARGGEGGEHVADGLTKHGGKHKMEMHAAWCGGVVGMNWYCVRALFGGETVLVCVGVFCPSGRWRHLVSFLENSSIWETIVASIAVKMNS